MHSPTADQSERTAVNIMCEAHSVLVRCHMPAIHIDTTSEQGDQKSIEERKVNFCHLFLSCSARRRGISDVDSRPAPFLLLGDFKHAKALVLLQQFIFGPDLLPQVLQLLLLLLWAHTNAGHGADQLPHLLELVLELIQHLMNILAVLVHAVENRKRRHYSVLLLESEQPAGATVISSATRA